MPWLRPKMAVHGAFAFAALMLLLAGYSLHDNTRRARAASQAVVHTQDVLAQIHQAREQFALLEAAQRGYLLSGDDSYRDERDRATIRTRQALGRLRELTTDNLPQTQRVDQAVALLAQRLDVAERAAQARLADGFAAPWPAEATRRARAVAARYQIITAAMYDEETRLLAQRQMDEAREQADIQLALGLLMLAGLLVLLPGYYGLMRQWRQREQLERRMADLVEALPQTVWQIHTTAQGERRFVFVSASVLRERGLHGPDVLRDINVVLDSIHEADRPRVRAAMDHAERTLEPFDERYRIRMPDGSTRWLHSRGNLRRESDGSTLWSGYWQDISRQQQMEDALMQATEVADAANQSKSAFLATMSHEIRTPMNGVLGLLELLSLTRLDAAQRSTLAVVRESGRALLRIVDDILDFSRVEAGRLALNPVPGSVRDAVTRACQIHSGIASSRGLLLRQEVGPGISPALVFDPLRLGQILNNFISNALKFTQQGGVDVSVHLLGRTEQGESLRFQVRDTGIGVSAEQVEQLFEPFVQADSGTAGRFGGSGLGLAISRRLAQLMGGTVRMISQPGEGTTMQMDLCFPVADAALLPPDGQAAQQALQSTVSARRLAPPAAQAEAEGTLVLVVDDHPTNRVVISRQVAALGYACLTAGDGLEALELWKTRRIGLVLTDCNMPELNGHELTREIRRLEARDGRARTPVLACTANALGSEAATCADSGMDDVLVKPVGLLALMQSLDRWLPLTTPLAVAPPTPPPSAQPMTLQPTPMPAEVPVDMAVLDALIGSDADSQRAVLLDLRQVNDSDAQLLSDAVQAANHLRVSQLAHRMMGAARMIGAHDLSRVCRAIETAARNGDTLAMTSEHDRLGAELRRLNAYLDRLASAPPADGEPPGPG